LVPAGDGGIETGFEMIHPQMLPAWKGDRGPGTSGTRGCGIPAPNPTPEPLPSV
jgi:hypothetical protein